MFGHLYQYIIINSSHYLRSGFVIDLMACLPYDALNAFSSNSSFYTNIFSILKVIQQSSYNDHYCKLPGYETLQTGKGGQEYPEISGVSFPAASSDDGILSDCLSLVRLCLVITTSQNYTCEEVDIIKGDRANFSFRDFKPYFLHQFLLES